MRSSPPSLPPKQPPDEPLPVVAGLLLFAAAGVAAFTLWRRGLRTDRSGAQSSMGRLTRDLIDEADAGEVLAALDAWWAAVGRRRSRPTGKGLSRPARPSSPSFAPRRTSRSGRSAPRFAGPRCRGGRSVGGELAARRAWGEPVTTATPYTLLCPGSWCCRRWRTTRPRADRRRIGEFSPLAPRRASRSLGVCREVR